MPHTTKQRTHAGGGAGDQGQSRQIQISKALSRLLRHSAAQDRIPIDRRGYIRLDHVLGWGKLKGMHVDGAEVLDVVGGSEKMRFGVIWDRTGGRGEGKGQGQIEDGTETQQLIDEEPEAVATEGQVQSQTQRALEMFGSGGDIDARHFFVRANQGHSMKGVEAEELLTEITLASLMNGDGNGEAQDSGGQSIKEEEEEWWRTGVVVHGTFYAAWENILREGALRRMGRNHVHFSTGPAAEDVLRALDGVTRDGDGGNLGTGGKGNGKGKGSRLSKLMDQSKVVSGMRRDAEVLIYVNMRRALEQRQEEGQGMKWWRSENGVVLTEGQGEDGMVAVEYWEKAVEVKEGLGMLWEDGAVKIELPERLRGRGMPMGKTSGTGRERGGRGGRWERGRGGGEVTGEQRSGNHGTGDKST